MNQTQKNTPSPKPNGNVKSELNKVYDDAEQELRELLVQAKNLAEKLQKNKT